MDKAQHYTGLNAQNQPQLRQKPCSSMNRLIGGGQL
jgi:hypothetical protein